MTRLVLACRCFYEILVHGRLSDATMDALGIGKPEVPAAPSSPAVSPPVGSSADGALQLLAILQRDARLVDFVMEDISRYSDDQVGAAVRELHAQCRQSLARYVHLVPVIDAAENTPTVLPGGAGDPATVKFVGNVPATGSPAGGILRHRGWRAETVELPPVPRDGVRVIAPAEIEVE